LKWSIGLVPCDVKYSISSHGRLHSPYTGKITRGFAARGTRWAAVKGSGLVDLLAASGLTRAEVEVPVRTEKAYLSIVQGFTPSEHAERNFLTENTAWTYMNVAAPLVPNLHVYARRLVSQDLWELLSSMRGDALLGGALKALHAECSRLLGHDVSWSELRLARTSLV
jgi:hypothetical protein